MGWLPESNCVPHGLYLGNAFQARSELDGLLGAPTENFVPITFVDKKSKELMKVKNS